MQEFQQDDLDLLQFIHCQLSIPTSSLIASAQEPRRFHPARLKGFDEIPVHEVDLFDIFKHPEDFFLIVIISATFLSPHDIPDHLTLLKYAIPGIVQRWSSSAGPDCDIFTVFGQKDPLGIRSMLLLPSTAGEHDVSPCNTGIVPLQASWRIQDD